MGSLLDKPQTDKHTEHGAGNGLRYGVSSMQGWRLEMEDAHSAVIGLKDLADWSFFAVFDGHAGPNVAAHCAENLLPSITGTVNFLKYAQNTSLEHSKSLATKPEQEQEQEGLKQVEVASTTTSTNTEASGTQSAVSKQQVDEEESADDDDEYEQDIKCDDVLSCDADNKHIQRIKAGIREGFLKLDEQMKSLPEMESGDDKSGSTAVCTMITPDYLFFANCGDSRAVLSRGGCPHFWTQDHKPINPNEKRRIVNAGGSVMIQRVNGSLAVSRALGDYEYKKALDRGPCEQLVSPEPEITVKKRDATDQFIVLACDGVWDVMSNSEMCEFVTHFLKLGYDVERICSTIIDTCLNLGSKDNMSLILVLFPGAPTLDPAVVKLEELIDPLIEKKVEEFVTLQKNITLQEVLTGLSICDFYDTFEQPIQLLQAKKNLIKEFYVKYKGEDDTTGDIDGDEDNNFIE